MSKGILLFARNNSQIDYVKQAYYLAIQAKKILNLPTTIVTDSTDYLKTAFKDYESVFDKIISIVWNEKDLNEYTTLSNTENHTYKEYNDGTIVKKKLQFKNETRSLAYDLTPYNETLLLDTDILLRNNLYLNCFNSVNNFLIYDSAYDLAGFRDPSEFQYISDAGIKFYWATAIFFRKTQENKIFFDLVKHIQKNWIHYKSIFQVKTAVFRNDHAFSIAIHIMNGYQNGSFAHKMPGKLFFITDKDICFKINDDSILILLEKQNYKGEYTVCKWGSHNLHVMNKFSLNRCIDELLNE